MSRVGEGAPDLVLASASPRRLDLLQIIGLEPMVLPADVDETPLPSEKPQELVERLARSKAEHVMAVLSDADSGPDSRSETGQANPARPGADRLVIAADTVIDIDGEVYGKPVDTANAADMLRALSGRSHDVVTGMAVVGLRNGVVVTEATMARTVVHLRAYGQDEIDWYIASGEPEGKAGAYAIQGRGSMLVDRIDGSYQNVVGLPLPVLDQLVGRFGWTLRELADI